MKRREFLSTVAAGSVGAKLTAKALAAGLNSPSVPPLAALNGYKNLIFDEEFDSFPDIGFGTVGHKWNAGLWWEPVPDPSVFIQAGSCLSIFAGTLADVNLCTQYHDHSGGTSFLGGYFEARMWISDWSAFWLFCWDRPTVWGSLVDPANPMTWTNEIDIVESDYKYHDSVWCTLHRNSSGDGLPDDQNYPAEVQCNTPMVKYWHDYGLLWTVDEVTWFIDEIPVRTVKPYASTWQPVQLVLTAAPGGVNGSPPDGSNPITKVDWVRVWGV